MTMTALVDPTETPEWAQARTDWRAQADGTLAATLAHLDPARTDDVARDKIYAPIHDIAGLAPVFGYHLLGKMARALMEMLRRSPDVLDPSTRGVVRTYLVAMSALHARDVRGEHGAEGDAILAELAAVAARD